MNFREAWNEGEIEAGTLLDEIDRLRAALLIAQQFCNSLTAEECPDTVAIPINEALLTPNA
jgi:hypothetical protein